MIMQVQSFSMLSLYWPPPTKKRGKQGARAFHMGLDAHCISSTAASCGST